MSGRLAHVPALDGLRGIALLGVVFFHASGALAGGYLGVDLFFVLSGFLITSLLVSEHEATGTISLSTFWVRRARRLFPALLSLMPAVAIYCWRFAKPEELAGLRGDALATLGYVANWRTIFAHKSYWEMFAAPSPLEHTWSLSIEEQFYVIWPLVAVVVLARGRRALFGVSAVLAVLSMVAMFVLSNAENTTRAYMGTDTRATSILAGAMLATSRSVWTQRATAPRWLDGLGIVAALVLGACWWKLDGQSPLLYRGGFWLCEACSLVLIVCATRGRASLVARVLAAGPLTYLGTISYGAYLWHWPVDVVLSEPRTHLHGVALIALQLGVTFAIAAVSYRFLELPIRVRGVPFGRPLVVVPAAVAVALVLVVRSTYARKPLADSSAGAPPPSFVLRAPFAEVGEPFHILVLGDSTANSLGWALRGVREPHVSIELRGKDSCTMLWDTCGGESWTSWTAEVKPNATLVFLGGAFLHGLTADGRWRQACYKKWNDQFEETLTKRLAGLATGEGRVWAVTAPYPLGPYDSTPWRELIDCINASIRKVASGVPGMGILDLGGYLCPKGECEREHNGVTIRPDGVHYDMVGAEAMARWVLAQALPDRAAK